MTFVQAWRRGRMRLRLEAAFRKIAREHAAPPARARSTQSTQAKSWWPNKPVDYLPESAWPRLLALVWWQCRADSASEMSLRLENGRLEYVIDGTPYAMVAPPSVYTGAFARALCHAFALSHVRREGELRLDTPHGCWILSASFQGSAFEKAARIVVTGFQNCPFHVFDPGPAMSPDAPFLDCLQA